MHDNLWARVFVAHSTANENHAASANEDKKAMLTMLEKTKWRH